jgi:hypothetical protein
MPDSLLANEIFACRVSRRWARSAFPNLKDEDMTEMTSSESSQTRTSLRNPIILRYERVEDFESLHERLKREIKPRDFIQEIYVADIAALVWDIMRYRRIKSSTLNNAYKRALQNILAQIMCAAGTIERSNMYRVKAEKLASKWFTSQEAKEQVTKLLGRHQLDEDSILAEAFRLTAPEIERIDQMIAFAEVRRDRALRSIAEHRGRLANDLEQSSNRILENDALQAEGERNIDEPKAN